MKKFVIKYPIATYYIITFIISWGGLILLIGGPGKITSQSIKAPFLLLYLITVAGPVISGVLLTGLYHGKKGYRDLFSRLFKWHIPVKWYAVALLIFPLTVFAALFVLSLFSPVYMPGIFDSGTHPIASAFGLPGGDKITLVSFVFILGLFNGFVEELGWTGFVTPLLSLKQNIVKASITLGIMWGLWHSLANYLGSDAGAGSVSLFLYIPVMLFSFLPPFRILMIWVYRHTGSLLIAVLMHASLNMFWMLSMPLSITGKERMVWYLLWAAVLWSIVIIISVVNNKKKAIRNTFRLPGVLPHSQYNIIE